MSAESVCKSALNWIIAEIFTETQNENNEFVIGIGSGSTIVPFVKLLSDFISSNPNKYSITCIPTSEQARHLILEHLKSSKSFKLRTLDECENLNVTIDGADSVYFKNKFLIKGGGAAHCQEKIVAEASENYIIVIADEKKIERSIEDVIIPVEIIPLSLNSVVRMLKKEFGVDLKSCNVRTCPPGCGKIGPIVTDNGNLVLDLKISPESKLVNNPRDFDSRIRQYAGVVETGIFWRLPNKSLVIFPEKDNEITHKMI